MAAVLLAGAACTTVAPDAALDAADAAPTADLEPDAEVAGASDAAEGDASAPDAAAEVPEADGSADVPADVPDDALADAGCQAAADCPAPLEACKVASCIDGVCGAKAAADGAPCDDAEVCSAVDSCQGGACAPGTWTCACKVDADCGAKEDGDLCNGTLYCDASHSCTVNPVTVVACDPSKGSVCAPNACVPASGTCAPAPVGDATLTDCDDGDACTMGDVCVGGLCKAGTWTCACTTDAQCLGSDDGDLCNGTLYCDKSKGTCATNPATVVSCQTFADTACKATTCVKATGTCQALPQAEGQACDDGNACTTGEACQGGACAASANANSCLCKTDADCKAKEDGDLCNGTLYCELASGTCALNPATVVSCPTAGDTACRKAQCQKGTGSCALVDVAKGAPCDDLDPCTTGETCGSGVCLPDTATLTCPCQTDADCSADGQDLCLGPRFCNKATKACQVNPAAKVICSSLDDTACKKAVCQPKTGACALLPVHQGEACDDGDAATSKDTCHLGACTGTQLGACTKDADCASLVASDDLCSGKLYCDKVAGLCALNPGSVIACSPKDDTACKKASCQPKTGACALLPAQLLAPCDDGDPCTADSVCLGDGSCKGGASICACKQDADCAAKDDGDLCNGTWHCDPQSAPFLACKAKPGSAVACDAKANGPCVANQCQPKTGACQLLPLASAAGKPCEDGDACTEATLCLNGVCKGAAKACDDGNACTADACDAQAGCASLPAAGTCTDGDACTEGDACALGACKGKAKDCDDGNPCSADSCDSQSGACGYSVKTGPCKDGDSCQVFACAGGVCQERRGAVITVAGTQGSAYVDGSADSAQFQRPQGIGVSKDGSVYVADRPAYRVRKIADPLGPQAQVSTVVGSGKQGKLDGKGAAAQLYDPLDVDVADDGAALAIGDGDGVRVVRVTLADAAATTLAGGVQGNVDAKGAAAKFCYVAGVAFDAQGAVYVADECNHTIRKVAPDGTTTTVAGTGSAGYADGLGQAAAFQAPGGVDVDGKGRVYVADQENNRIRRIEVGGMVTTVAGSGEKGHKDGPALQALLNDTSRVAVDSAGVVYLADDENAVIRRLGLDGVVTTVAGIPGRHGDRDGDFGHAMLHDPSDVAVGNGGLVYIGDDDNDRIRVLLPAASAACDDGNSCTVETCNPALGACAHQPLAGSCLAADGCVYGTCEAGSCKEDGDTLVTAAGSGATSSGGSADSGPASLAAIGTVDGVAIAADGTVYTSDSSEHVIRRLDLQGQVSVIAGGAAPDLADGKGALAGFDNPTSLALDPKSSLLWITDTDNHRVRSMTADGTVTTVFGGGSTSSSAGSFADGAPTAARFAGPYGLAAHPDGGYLFVSDGNHRVRRLTLGADAKVETWAGNGQNATVDGAKGVAALQCPAGLAVDPQGVVYVADYCAERVRRVDTDGSILTLAGTGTFGFQDGPALQATFADLLAVLWTPQALLLVDEDNHRIRRLEADAAAPIKGKVSTLLGTIRGHRDGGLATAREHLPSSLAIDSKGFLWLGSAGSRRLRFVQPAAGGCPAGRSCSAGLCTP